MAVNRLPPEVLSLIISSTTQKSTLGRTFFPSSKCFLSCCLVCRRWLQATQILMYSEIELDSGNDLVLVHRTLINSETLGDYVLCLTIGPLHTESRRLSHARAEQMLVECLERTRQLARLTFRSGSSQYFTKLVADCVHRLSKLKGFAFDHSGEILTEEDYDGEGSDSQEKYQQYGIDPDGLLALPKSIQELEFSFPWGGVLKVLPQLCANLSQAAPDNDFQFPGQSDNAGGFLTQPDGLRVLSLEVGPTRDGHIPRVQEFYSKLSFSFSSTLTSFKLYDSPPFETENLIRLLSATPLLEHLRLYHVVPSGDLFGSLKPFTKLETFGGALRGLDRSEWTSSEECVPFCQSLINSISHSPQLNTFNLMCTGVPRPSSDFVGSFVRGLVAATSMDESPQLSRLCELNINCFAELPIDALEELCQAAPKLQQLYVLLPTAQNDDMSRVVNALKNLTELVALQVNDVDLQRAPGQSSLNLESLLCSS